MAQLIGGLRRCADRGTSLIKEDIRDASGPNGGLAELAQDADLFVCEATLADGDEDRDGTPRGHLSAREAESVSAAAGAKRLLLTHRPIERPLDPRFEQSADGMVVVV